jgi:hypothetical protein
MQNSAPAFRRRAPANCISIKRVGHTLGGSNRAEEGPSKALEHPNREDARKHHKWHNRYRPEHKNVCPHGRFINANDAIRIAPM